jgi:gentisate 1,2-dioxygenase
MNTNIGKWPVDGKDARKTGTFYKVTRENMLRMIHGEEHPVVMNFFVSNDLVHVGKLEIPCGGKGPRISQVDQHKGDAVFYVEAGPVTFFFPDTYDVFHVQIGDYMFIPENTKYQCINYTDQVIKAVFIIAPEL